MLIDKGTAMLVSTSLTEDAGPDGLYMAVFIPIQSILDLQHTDRHLIGHYWIDVDDKDLVVQHLSRREVNRIIRFLDKDRYVAIGTKAQRGRGVRAVRLDGNGDPCVKYTYTWRNPERYLSDVQLHWLSQSTEVANEFAEKSFAVAAISEFVQALSRKQGAVKKVKPKKGRVKAKDRRRRAVSGAIR